MALKSIELQKSAPLLQEEHSDHALHCLSGDGSGLALVLGNFQCRGVPLIWIIIGQSPSVLAVGAEGVFG